MCQVKDKGGSNKITAKKQGQIFQDGLCHRKYFFILTMKNIVDRYKGNNLCFLKKEYFDLM